jgi:NTP pyrophosphatase (non-canonical NTP hydrolase)
MRARAGIRTRSSCLQESGDRVQRRYRELSGVTFNRLTCMYPLGQGHHQQRRRAVVLSRLLSRPRPQIISSTHIEPVQADTLPHMTTPISLQFLNASLERCNRWHTGGIADWSINDWLVATGGELGEAMNVAKKLRRIEDNIANESGDPARHVTSVEEATDLLAEELADTLSYLVLVAARAGIDLNQATIDKFNTVSERYGFPERIGQ